MLLRVLLPLLARRSIPTTPRPSLRRSNSLLRSLGASRGHVDVEQAVVACGGVGD